MSESIVDKLRYVASEINKDLEGDIAVAGPDPNLSDAGSVRIPTTSHMINLFLGGGVPIGRVVELFGDESVGKSTVMQHMMVGFQKAKGISVLLDAETGWDRHRANAMGHDNDRHLHLQADTVEGGEKAIVTTLERLRMPGRFPTTCPIGIFWDTISSSQTEGEKEGDIYKDGMMDKPRKVRSMLRKIAPMLPRLNSSLVFICQTTVKMNKGSGAPPRKTSATGGDAIKFWSAKRLSMWRSGSFKYPHVGAGILSGIKNVKDKLNAPNVELTIPILSDVGIHPGYEVLIYVIDNSNIANVRGGKVIIEDYFDEGEDLVFYMKELPKVMVDNPELLEYLRACATDIWDKTGGR